MSWKTGCQAGRAHTWLLSEIMNSSLSDRISSATLDFARQVLGSREPLPCYCNAYPTGGEIDSILPVLKGESMCLLLSRTCFGDGSMPYLHLLDILPV